jgi:hypothetical protein
MKLHIQLNYEGQCRRFHVSVKFCKHVILAVYAAYFGLCFEYIELQIATSHRIFWALYT